MCMRWFFFLLCGVLALRILRPGHKDFLFYSYSRVDELAAARLAPDRARERALVDARVCIACNQGETLLAIHTYWST